MRLRFLLSALLLLICNCSEHSSPGRELKESTKPQSLPILGTLPEFTLTDHTGSPFGTDQLESNLWVANFIFTRCPATCPMQSARMAELQDRLKVKDLWAEITLVSFSVDPEFDSPDVLREYGKRFGADPQKWRFVTGMRDEIWNLSKDGFKLAVGENPPDQTNQPLFHSQRLVIVDRNRQIRGYYDGVSQEGLDQAEFAIGLVALEHSSATQ